METIRELLGDLQDKAEKAQAAKLSGTWKGWLIALVVGVSISLGAAWLLYMLRRRNASLARARTELEQQEARLKGLEYARQVAIHDAEIKSLETEAALLKMKIKVTKGRLADQQRETDLAVAEALKVRDWATLDARNKEDR